MEPHAETVGTDTAGSPCTRHATRITLSKFPLWAGTNIISAFIPWMWLQARQALDEASGWCLRRNDPLWFRKEGTCRHASWGPASGAMRNAKQGEGDSGAGGGRGERDGRCLVADRLLSAHGFGSAEVSWRPVNAAPLLNIHSGKLRRGWVAEA